MTTTATSILSMLEIIENLIIIYLMLNITRMESRHQRMISLSRPTSIESNEVLAHSTAL